MSTIFYLPKQSPLDTASNLMAGAKLYFYVTATSTPKDTYSDFALTTPNTNPVVADGSGVFSTIYLSDVGRYRVVLKTSADVTQYTQDDVGAAVASQAELGAILYPLTTAENAAGVTPVNYYRVPGDVRRYGAITGSGGADTAIVQAAINQAMQSGGDPWFIPRGVTASCQTSGSTTAPVGNALTITAACLGKIDGRLVGNNNCNLIQNTASDVTITGSGSLEGYGTFFTGSGVTNGSLFFNNGGNNVNFLLDGQLVNPPQYAVWYRGATATGGRIANFRIVGGPTTLSGNEQHYGVLIDGLFTGLDIGPFQTVKVSGGAVGQGLVSNSSLARPTGLNVHDLTFNGCLDHGVYLACNNSKIANIQALSCASSTRIIGTGNACSGFRVDGGPGIELQSFNQGHLVGFTITNYTGICFSLQPRFGEATDDCISQVVISDGLILGKVSDTTVRTALRVRTVESSGSTETNNKDITIANIIIKDAAQSSDSDPAIELQVGTAKTVQRLKLKNCTIDTCGFRDIIKASAGTLLDAEIDENTIINPGSAASASGSQTHAIRIVAGTLTNGSISRNVARDDRGGSATMVTAFSNAGTVTATLCDSNRAIGFTTSQGTFGAAAYTARAFETNTFTGTLTGCTTSPTGSIAYSVQGDVITLQVPVITGTSNTTAATITGIPADISPGSTQVVDALSTDNGVTALSRWSISTGGTITLNFGVTATFTNSGTKGVAAVTINYRLTA